MKRNSALVNKLENLPKVNLIFLCILIFTTFFLLGVIGGKAINAVKIDFLKREELINEEKAKERILQKIQTKSVSPNTIKQQ